MVMEAMSAGLPVIGTDIRGNRDLIQPGKTGYLVGVDDAGQMAQAIKRLAEDENLRREMGAGGQTAILPFGREQVAKEMKKIYCSLEGQTWKDK